MSPLSSLPLRGAALVVALLALAACGGDDTPDTTPADTLPDSLAVEATGGMGDEVSVAIEPLGDSGVSGTVTFRPTDGGVQVTYAVDGLTPGLHGFHVHANGDCGAGPDGAPGGAAGGHFAPMDDAHGAPDDPAPQRHVGDFGNIEAGTDGRAAGTFVDPLASLGADERSIVGRAVVVHAEADDLTSQPSGAAGARVGCGVVRLAAVPMPGDALPPGHPPVDLPPGHPPIDGSSSDV